MFTDYILNGQPHGDVANQFADFRSEPNLLRSYIDHRGKLCVDVRCMVTNTKTGRKEPGFRKVLVRDARDMGIDIPLDVTNATSLRKDEWLRFDEAVLRESRQRMKAWTDLANANSVGGFDGMSKTSLEWETMTDPGSALVDMDATSVGRNDAPQFQLERVPLPITHSDFFIKKRQLMVSRNTGEPLDTTGAEMAGRRVAEQIEKSVIGNVTAYAYGVSPSGAQTPKVYGYATHPHRNTKTDVTTPTGSNGPTTVTEVLTMLATLRTDGFFGPYMIYHSTDWSRFMDTDYSTAKGDITLRERLRNIEEVSDVRQLDFLTATFTLLIVQMTSDVARAINGMPITTLRWETRGGMQINYKVMAIQVPNIRSTAAGNCGIVHATTA